MSWYGREVVAPHDERRGLVPSIGQRLIAGAHVLAGAYTGEPKIHSLSFLLLARNPYP